MIEELQELLHAEIPLTKAIGIEVREYSEYALTLYAPLRNNINHKCTAFGGSLYSLAVLSGWGLIYLLLRQYGLSGHIVIQESHTKFNKPVVSDMSARCGFDSEAQYQKFIQMYQRKGIARIQLQSRITCNADTNVLFTGKYVVHK
jgi:thioesterase domain-containing protein